MAVQAKGSFTKALNIAASVGAFSKVASGKARRYRPDKNPHNYNLYMADEKEPVHDDNDNGNEVGFELEDEGDWEDDLI